MHQYHNEFLGKSMPSMKESNSKPNNQIVYPLELFHLPIFNPQSLQQHPVFNQPQDSAAVFSNKIVPVTMRLLLLTTLLALLATLVLATDGITCRSDNSNGENNRDIVQAINAFCGCTWDLVSTVFHLPHPFTPITPLP